MSDLRRGSRNRPCARFKKNKTYLSTISAGVIAIVMMTLVPMNVVKLTLTLADHKATAHNIGRLCHEDVGHFKKNKTYLSTLSARVIAIVMMTLVPMNAVKLTLTLADHKATAHNI